MGYYLFKECRLARDCGSLGEYEWLIDGVWERCDRLSLALNDARMDYGGYSVFDYEDIMPEIAVELIQNGTAVLQRNMWGGYKESKKIQLIDFQRPSKN